MSKTVSSMHAIFTLVAKRLFPALGVLPAVALLVFLTQCTPLKTIDSQPINPISFKIRLADTPGPDGHPFAYTPWKISRGNEPDGLDFIRDDDLLAGGETNADGFAVCDAAENLKLAEALSNPATKVWLSYPGQAVQMFKLDVSPSWSKEMRLFYWLKTESLLNGTATYYEGILQSPEGQDQLRYAMEMYQADNLDALYVHVDLPSSGPVIYFSK